ncbi:MAG: hypothetical protein H0T60_13535 [Acidobacteria bacterium]|nr:hypothetical protein [Acidobacteriota bacterium]
MHEEDRIRLKDLQVWHWWFFLRGFDVEFIPGSKRHKDFHWPVWRAALVAAMKWGGYLSPPEGRLPEEEPSVLDYPFLFADTKRVEDGGQERSLQAYSLLDATYINVVWTSGGESAPQILSGIRQREWQYTAAQSGPPYLGEAVCLSAVMLGTLNKGAKPEKTEERAKGAVKEILLGWCGKEVSSVELIEFACGYYATSQELGETVWVLLVWDEEAAEPQAAHILIDLTPSFMLAWLKGRYIRVRYDRHILPEVNAIEGDLERVLKEIEAQPLKLKSLEESSLLITSPLDELSKRIAQIREYLETLKINIGNLKILLKYPVFKPGQAQMSSLLVAPLRQSAEQLQAYLTYKEITQDRARARLDLFKIRAEILSQKGTREITILLGLFVVFGVVQAFDREIGAYGGQDALLLKLLIVFVLIIMLWGRLERQQDE